MAVLLRLAFLGPSAVQNDGTTANRTNRKKRRKNKYVVHHRAKVPAHADLEISGDRETKKKLTLHSGTLFIRRVIRTATLPRVATTALSSKEERDSALVASGETIGSSSLDRSQCEDEDEASNIAMEPLVAMSEINAARHRTIKLTQKKGVSSPGVNRIAKATWVPCALLDLGFRVGELWNVLAP